MRWRTEIQIALLIVGVIVWAARPSPGDRPLQYAGIGCFAVATALRFFRNRRQSSLASERCRDDASAGAAACGRLARLPPVPDAALTVLGDDARESLGRVVPVRLDGALRRDAVASGDRANDELVLLHRRRKLVEQRRDVEADVALRLRLDRAVQGDDARARDVLHVRPVELHVQIEDPVDARLFARLHAEVAIQLA